MTDVIDNLHAAIALVKGDYEDQLMNTFFDGIEYDQLIEGWRDVVIDDPDDDGVEKALHDAILATKHLPGKHEQKTHGGYGDKKTVEIVGDRIQDTDAFQWLQTAPFDPKYGTSILALYDLASGRLAVSLDKSQTDDKRGVLSHESLASQAFDAENADKMVHLYIGKRAPIGELGVWATTDSGGADRMDDGLDNIYRAFDKLVSVGLPKATPTKVHLGEIGNVLQGILKNRVDMHLPGKHDQKTHAAKAGQARLDGVTAALVYHGPDPVFGNRSSDEDTINDDTDAIEIFEPEHVTAVKPFSRWIYDLGTGKTYFSDSAWSHASMADAVGIPLDRTVRAWATDESELKFSIFESGVDQDHPDFETQAFKNIDKANDALIRLGLPISTPVIMHTRAIKDYKTTLKSFAEKSGTVKGARKAWLLRKRRQLQDAIAAALQSRDAKKAARAQRLLQAIQEVKHLPGKHDQKTHGHGANRSDFVESVLPGTLDLNQKVTLSDGRVGMATGRARGNLKSATQFARDVTSKYGREFVVHEVDGVYNIIAIGFDPTVRVTREEEGVGPKPQRVIRPVPRKVTGQSETRQALMALFNISERSTEYDDRAASAIQIGEKILYDAIQGASVRLKTIETFYNEPDVVNVYEVAKKFDLVADDSNLLEMSAENALRLADVFQSQSSSAYDSSGLLAERIRSQVRVGLLSDHLILAYSTASKVAFESRFQPTDALKGAASWLQLNVATDDVSATVYMTADSTRGFARKGEGLYVGQASQGTTVVHEYGHWIELSKPGVKAAARQFRSDRTKGSKLISLRRLAKGQSYGQHESAYKDKFIDPYVGKYYASGSTEVISMGLEAMYRGPLSFLQLDSDHFFLTLAVIHGQL